MNRGVGFQDFAIDKALPPSLNEKVPLKCGASHRNLSMRKKKHMNKFNDSAFLCLMAILAAPFE